MQRTTVQVGPFEVNCSVLAWGDRAWIVDPGAEPDRIAAVLERARLAPEAILLTHGHFDHIGAIPALQSKWPGLKVYMHPADERVIAHPLNSFPPDYPAIGRPANICDVRELEGALISLIAQSTLNRKQIDMDLTRQMIDKYVQSSAREITIDYIQKVVCDYLQLPVDVIQNTSRKREIVQARQLSMYFSKKITKSSLAVIGMQCGNKDHATVLHACKQIENLRQTDRYMRTMVEELEKKLSE